MLIVFSASPGLRARFERLYSNPDWEVALVDPFSLYVIILDELWLQAESIVNGVREVFGVMERVCDPFSTTLCSHRQDSDTNISDRARPVFECTNWGAE